MSTQTAPRRRNGKPLPQSRIELMRVLTEAGADGMATEALTVVLLGVGITQDTAKSLLYRSKRDEQIFGKGCYVDGRGIRFRYFAEAAWCEAYEFPACDFVATDEKAERKRIREKARHERMRAEETPEQRELRLAEKRDKVRARLWAAKGYSEPPPRKERAMGLSAQEKLDRERERCREKWRKQRDANALARADAGLVPAGRRSSPRKVAAEGAPGKTLVVVLKGTQAPVKTTRPVLVGEVDMSRAKVTVAATPRDSRYWVDPASVRSVFGALPLGQYLEVCDAV